MTLGRPPPSADALLLQAGRGLAVEAPERRAYPAASHLGDAMAEPIGRAGDGTGWEGMKRTLRHLMIMAAILGVAAAIGFLVLADVMCLGDLCR